MCINIHYLLIIADIRKMTFCVLICANMWLLLVLPVLAPLVLNSLGLFMALCSVLLLQHIPGPSRDQLVFVHLLAQSGYGAELSALAGSNPMGSWVFLGHFSQQDIE